MVVQTMLKTIIVVGVLASISIPAYQDYMTRNSIQPCLLEAQAYSTSVVLAQNAKEDRSTVVEPIVKECASITDATQWNNRSRRVIIAVPKSNPTIRIECDLSNDESCQLRL